MTIKDRIFLFIQTKGINKSRFEKAAGLSNGYLNSLKKSIGSEKIEDILNAFPDLNRTWLLTGEGEMLKPPKNEYSQIFQQEMKEIWAEEFDKYLVRMYKEGDIYPAAVVDKMMAEKEAKIEELQKRIWELEKRLARE